MVPKVFSDVQMRDTPDVSSGPENLRFDNQYRMSRCAGRTIFSERERTEITDPLMYLKAGLFDARQVITFELVCSKGSGTHSFVDPF